METINELAGHQRKLTETEAIEFSSTLCIDDWHRWNKLDDLHGPIRATEILQMEQQQREIEQLTERIRHKQDDCAKPEDAFGNARGAYSAALSYREELQKRVGAERVVELVGPPPSKPAPLRRESAPEVAVPVVEPAPQRETRRRRTRAVPRPSIEALLKRAGILDTKPGEWKLAPDWFTCRYVIHPDAGLINIATGRHARPTWDKAHKNRILRVRDRRTGEQKTYQIGFVWRHAVKYTKTTRRGAPRKYDAIDIAEARKLYAELKSLGKVSERTGISPKRLCTWGIANEWRTSGAN